MGLRFSLSLSAMGDCLRSMLRKLRRNRTAEKYASLANSVACRVRMEQERRGGRLFVYISHFMISGPSSCSSWDWTMPGSPRYWITLAAVNLLRNRFNVEEIRGKFITMWWRFDTTHHSLSVDSDQNVLPTIGFRTVSLKSKSYSTKIYDLGGSSQIRALWPKYYNDVSDA